MDWLIDFADAHGHKVMDVCIVVEALLIVAVIVAQVWKWGAR